MIQASTQHHLLDDRHHHPNLKSARTTAKNLDFLNDSL